MALDERFQAAFNGVLARWPAVFGGTELDPDANRTRMEALVRRVEDLATSLAGGPGAAGRDTALSPTTRLAAMLKEALAANTIGGKVDEASRWRAAQEDVRQAQASWARIGPVAEETRRALADRFARACRRITEGAGRAKASLIAISSTSNTSIPYGALVPLYARLSGIQKRIFWPSTINCTPSVHPAMTPST